jgi:hypothetical protein
MTILDAEATFVRLDKLRERMNRLEKSPDSDEWQYTRLLIRALAESVLKAKKCSGPVTRKVVHDAPGPVSGEWRELLEALQKKGIKSESRAAAERREQA